MALNAFLFSLFSNNAVTHAETNTVKKFSQLTYFKPLYERTLAKRNTSMSSCIFDQLQGLRKLNKVNRKLLVKFDNFVRANGRNESWRKRKKVNATKQVTNVARM